MKIQFFKQALSEKRMCSQSNTGSNNDTEDETDDVTVSDTVSDTLSDSGCSFGDWCKTFWIRIGYSIAYICDRVGVEDLV